MTQGKRSRKYQKPPIKEAIIEIKLDDKNLGGVKAIEQLAQSIGDDLHSWGQNIRMQTHSENYGESQQKNIVGIVMMDKQSRRSLHLDIDRIAYILLGYYESWEKFEVSFLKYWDEFIDLFNRKTKIRRIGVRFINDIEIQLDSLDELDQYTEVGFTVPQMLYHSEPAAQEILQRNLFLIDGMQCIVIKTLQKDKQTDKFNFRLDIDASQSPDFDISNKENLTAVLRQLRGLKNDVFESSITDITRQLFK